MRNVVIAGGIALGAIGGYITISVGGPAGASTGPEVVISELMIDPRDTYDSRGEWVELFNGGDATAQLAGWTLTDGRTEQAVLPALSIAPGERLVLTRNGDAYANGGAVSNWVYGNKIVLFNDADRLILSDASGTEQDRVDWYPESGITVPNGRSLALRGDSADGSDAASWCASTSIMVRGDLGSPGAPNRCDAPTAPVVITEVMQNPRRTGDSTGEWFEVYNPSDSVVDLAGWTVKDDDRERFVITGSVPVAPHGYAVLGNSEIANGGIDLDFEYGLSMSLRNDWDELALADADGLLVDRLAWDNGGRFPDPDGASMSLIDPSLDNSLGASWCTATTSWAAGDLGTPHAATWCQPPGVQPIVITEVMFDPETPASERASEWFEIANIGATPVDLTGWSIIAGDYKTHTINGLVVAPGTVAVLASSGDTTKNGGVAAQYVYGTSPEVPLYNASGRVILKSPAGAIVDRVEWSATRGFPIPSGASISLGFPTANNELGANWCESNARWGSGDFGSPGLVSTCVAPPAAPAVAISEVMRNPGVVGDSQGEWFELHNLGGDDVNIRGWSLTDGASDRHVVTSDVIVPAGGYLVLGRTANTATNGGAPVGYAYGDGFVLSNNDDRIVVRDQYDQLVNEVAWAKADGTPRPNGASMAATPDGWCVSGPQFGLGDLGTPGAANDCTPLAHRDVVISEIHIDPNAVSDTTGEWIEITNNTSQPVDLAGWVLRDDDADAHTIAAGGSLVVAPGSAVVLGRDLSPTINGGAPVNYSYNAGFPLSNDEDEITLLDSSLVWVDRVAWTLNRPLPVKPGVSASLRALSADNSDPANWCGSVTPFGTYGEIGTPGAANQCEIAQPPVDTSSTTSSTTQPSTTTSSTTTTTTTTAPPTTTSTTSTSTTSTTTSTTTTTTTTVPPVRPLTRGFGIVSLAGSGCGNGLQLSGSSIRVEGGLRSNGNVMVQGSSVSVNGTISYGGSKNVGSNVVHGGLVNSTTPVLPGFAWTIADFAPGGSLSTRPGYVAHLGSWTISGSGAAPGIHYVVGDVTISGSAPDLVGVTIVATGSVTISGGSVLSPAANDLPAVFANGGSCWGAAINLSGSSVTWSGVLAAPNGVAQINGSQLRGGSVLAASIQMSGSDIVLG